MTTTIEKALVNVLGVVYVHVKSSDGGDLYLTRFAEPYHKVLDTANWYEKEWFDKHKLKLLGTSSVFKVPTRMVDGISLDLVVKNCRVGEDVPFNTHTLEEFMGAEFNSPWEEFAFVMEMREGNYGPMDFKFKTQHPLAIYVPPETMQLWQSGRSKSKINRIRARHPGIDLDILKQYKLIYGWIRGKNLTEMFEHIDMQLHEAAEYLKDLTHQAMKDMNRKGYYMADMKPEHVIIAEGDALRIEDVARTGGPHAAREQVSMLSSLVDRCEYSLIDYELLFRTPDHDDQVKSLRRHSYLDDQRDRFIPTELPPHLSYQEVFGVPYVCGHTESTGGNLWVVGKNARLFDYFLPERWRKTTSLSLSDINEAFYTVTKDNIHLVWKTSRVGELPEDGFSAEDMEKVRQRGINSPFEEFAIAQELNNLGIPAVYVRAIYRTGSNKLEQSRDMSRYESHSSLESPDGSPILMDDHNYITIRGYYNGPDEWVPEHEGALYTPVDLDKALHKGILEGAERMAMLERVNGRLRDAGYDGSLLKPNDLLLVLDSAQKIVTDADDRPFVIICNFELIWKLS